MTNQISSADWMNNKTHLCFPSSETHQDSLICSAKDECSMKGTLLPLLIEVTWPVWLRASLYFIGLLYSFIAVFIVADIFMCSIDSISSKTRTVFITGPDGNQESIQIPVWNGAVANLVLMSLGPRVAPEILLSLVGIVGNGFQQDKIGPSLIVGSGAFNLFVISAISVLVIPKGETRKIEKYSVFIINMFFCVVAYLWLLVILVLITPNKVDVWEAVLTLFFIPVMVYLSWVAERGWLDTLFCQRNSIKVNILNQSPDFYAILASRMVGRSEEKSRKILLEIYALLSQKYFSIFR